MVGYAEMKAIAAVLAKAKSTKTEDLIKAAEGIGFDTPFGPVSFRAIDHQSTMGAFVGKTAVVDGKGVMVDFRYVPGAQVLPPDSEVKTRCRPQRLSPAGRPPRTGVCGPCWTSSSPKG